MFSTTAEIQPQQQVENRLMSAQQHPEYTEDKKCRICGFADTKNVNIFSQTSCKALVTKILTVYPIVLYKNDPLPKNICKKCICNVSIMYNDILRVMKMQSKWIKNVRNVQPRHNYIRVLDMIENSNSVTKDSIKASLGEEINELTVERLLLSNAMDLQTTENSISPKQTTTPPKNVTPTQSAPSRITSMSFSMDYDDGVVRKAPDSTVSKKEKTTEMKDIKSLLELNGCSLLQVGANKSASQSSTELTTNSNNPSIMNIKKENFSEQDHDDKILDPMSPPSTSKISSQNSKLSPGPPPPLTVKCRLCPLQFNSLSSLAIHQVIHMRLCVPKIFQKKYLHKKIRRGRLISVNERKCIRCLNCWRVFIDNKSILEHWALGECDFYCHICGKEFAQAPKMLREHVPAAHGISYKSSKLHRVRLSTKIISSIGQTPVEENSDYNLYKSISEQEPVALEEQGGKSEISMEKSFNMKPTLSTSSFATTQHKKSFKFGHPTGKSSTFVSEDGSVACNICSKVFQNFKARNSHMRKHKPVYAYGDMVLPPLQGVNVYMKEQAKNNEFKYRSAGVEISSQPTTYQNYNVSCTPTTISTSHPSTPPQSTSPQISYIGNTSIKPSNPPRGVRTKFVQPREINGGVLKVKPLNELQKQSSSNALDSPSVFSSTEKSSSSTTWFTTEAATSSNHNDSTIDPLATKIKDEPMDLEPLDSSVHQQQQQLQPTVFTCIPCSEQFQSKLELFRHKRKCRAAYSFTCIYCSALFRCSADYQLHVAQVHGNSNLN